MPDRRKNIITDAGSGEGWGKGRRIVCKDIGKFQANGEVQRPAVQRAVRCNRLLDRCCLSLASFPQHDRQHQHEKRRSYRPGEAKKQEAFGERSREVDDAN